MLKNLVALIIASIVFMLGFSLFQRVIQWLLVLHYRLSTIISGIFSSGGTGDFIGRIISLLVMPLILGVVIYMIMWAMQKHDQESPYAICATWALWLIIAVATVFH